MSNLAQIQIYFSSHQIREEGVPLVISLGKETLKKAVTWQLAPMVTPGTAQPFLGILKVALTGIYSRQLESYVHTPMPGQPEAVCLCLLCFFAWYKNVNYDIRRQFKHGIGVEKLKLDPALRSGRSCLCVGILDGCVLCVELLRRFSFFLFIFILAFSVSVSHGPALVYVRRID